MFFGGGPGIHFVHGGMPGGIPFGMGGMPFGMGGDDDDDDERGQSGAVDNESYYKSLGVGKDASQSDIKKAYMKLARVVCTNYWLRRSSSSGLWA